MYISYSGHKLANCLRAYYFRYIAKVDPPKPSNSVHMLYGDTVGNIFEKFYEDQLWRDPKVKDRLTNMVRPTLSKIISKETSKGRVFNWDEPKLKKGNRSLEEVEQEVLETIPRGIQAIKHHRLVSRDARAEVKLDVDAGGHRLGGRSDFIMNRIKPHKDLVIVDGKGSRWREKYTNERQLRWYALLYWLNYGVIPDRLGFLYWRCQAEESMDWFEVSQSELEALLNSIVTTCDEIEKSKRELFKIKLKNKNDPGSLFMPNTSSECKLCDYLPLCADGQKHLSKDTKIEIGKELEHGVEDGGVSF